MSQLSVRGLRSAHVGPLDLDIASGECVALMGPSGSGKTLLMRLIADLDPGNGAVLLNGRARETWSAPQWRSQVVYQSAEPAWWAPTVAAHFPPQTLDAMRLLQPLLQHGRGTLQRLRLLLSGQTGRMSQRKSPLPGAHARCVMKKVDWCGGTPARTQFAAHRLHCHHLAQLQRCQAFSDLLLRYNIGKASAAILRQSSHKHLSLSSCNPTMLH